VTILSKHACSAEIAGTKTNTILGGKFVTQTNGTYVTRALENPYADNQDSFGSRFFWLGYFNSIKLGRERKGCKL
jgi:hypothetical protein